ncbi:MAG: flagellar hook-length control protein FliK [Sulfurospirillaceae bacterium]|nr:flagellar hook-length control protein FliK [Sulfurospirillaceae bacterium]
MKNIVSTQTAESPLSLAPTKNAKTTDKESSTTKNFISILFSELINKLENSKTTEKSTKEETKEESLLKKESSKETKSISNHLLSDILTIINVAKDKSATTFPSFSNKLEAIINDKAILKEFSEAKNIGDLLNLSKKYDLGLEKISVTKEEVKNLKADFPELEKDNFFEPFEKTISKQKDKPVTLSSINPLEAQTKTTKEPTPSILQNLMSKEETKEQAQIKEMSTLSKETQEVKKTIITEKIDAKNINEVEEIKIEKTEIKESIKKVEVSQTQTKTPLHVEMSTQKAVVGGKEDAKVTTEDKKIKVEVESTKNSEPKIAEKAEELKPTTRTNEVKIEASQTQKGLAETILQTIKSEKLESQKSLHVETQALNAEQRASTKETQTQEVVENKELFPEIKNDTKLTQKSDVSTLKQTISNAKESLSQFANDLREKIEAYKPPIMKVELSLNPKSLGDVDVTILTRGNNLHVNITSNTNTMTLFNQNQAEFKNSLVNMGFTNLEMNFSDQKHNENQHQNSQTRHGVFEEFGEEESLKESLSTIELVLPKYV